jgi:hypothetical protein
MTYAAATRAKCRRWVSQSTIVASSPARQQGAAAAAALPEHFQGNSLALLQAVYRNAKLDLRVRVVVMAAAVA